MSCFFAASIGMLTNTIKVIFVRYMKFVHNISHCSIHLFTGPVQPNQYC